MDNHGTDVTILNDLPQCLNEETVIAGIGDEPNEIF